MPYSKAGVKSQVDFSNFFEKEAEKRASVSTDSLPKWPKTTSRKLKILPGHLDAWQESNYLNHHWPHPNLHPQEPEANVEHWHSGMDHGHPNQ